MDSLSTINWPALPDHEVEPPIREIDHTGDDPGPEEIRGPELHLGQEASR